MPDVSTNIEQALVSVNVQAADVQTNLAQTSVSANVQAASVSANVQAANVQVDIAGAPGPQGEVGPAGGTSVEYPAGETLSAGRVVVIDGGDAFYFQPSDASHSGRAFGITTTSAVTGADISIQISGEATDAAFSAFSDVPLYVGDDGELQTTWPATGILQKAGFGTGTNKVKIDFSIQITQA